MKVFDLDAMGKKAYLWEMIWVTIKLGLHPSMELRHVYNIQLVHQFFSTVYCSDSDDGDIY
jgi:hypothetical protein